MKIIDRLAEREIKMVQLFLTRDEIERYIRYLQRLLQDEAGGHIHFATEDHQTEIETYIDHPAYRIAHR